LGCSPQIQRSSGLALPHSDISLKGTSYKSIYHVIYVLVRFPNRTSTTAAPPPLSTTPGTPLLLSLEPTADMGPNDDNVVWAPGKFIIIMFFAFYLIQLTYIFHFL
jgi:hypothetical protein